MVRTIQGALELCARLPAFVAAIDDICPVALPFLAPGERLAAGRADFGRQIVRVAKGFFFRHGRTFQVLVFRLADGRQRRRRFRDVRGGHPKLWILVEDLLVSGVGEMVMPTRIKTLVRRCLRVYSLLRDRVYLGITVRVFIAHNC